MADMVLYGHTADGRLPGDVRLDQGQISGDSDLLVEMARSLMTHGRDETAAMQALNQWSNGYLLVTDSPAGPDPWPGSKARAAARRGMDWDPDEYITRFDPAEKRGPRGEWVKGGALPAVDSLTHHTTSEGTIEPGRAELHSQIVADTIGHAPSHAKPMATFLGGGPASGKSTLGAPDPDNVHIDADAIKGRLPEYQAMVKAGDTRAAAYSHEESSTVAKQIRAAAIAGKRNFTLDGTGDSAFAKMAGSIKAARDAGYGVAGKYVTVDTDEAVRRARKRAERTGRMVPESVIREIHASVSDTFKQLIAHDLLDTAELWDNNGAEARLIGLKEAGGKWTVHDPAAYQRFLDKAGV